MDFPQEQDFEQDKDVIWGKPKAENCERIESTEGISNCCFESSVIKNKCMSEHAVRALSPFSWGRPPDPANKKWQP